MSNISFFVGACNKQDFILGLGTLLTRAGRRVLLVDAMNMPWLTYRNQTWINKEKWCRWNGMDTVSGILHWEELLQLSRQHEIELDAYDDILIDTDRLTFCDATTFISARERVMVQTVEAFAVHRNMEWIKSFRLLHEVDLNRDVRLLILNTVDHAKEVAYVVEHLQSIYVAPKEEAIFIPFEEENWTAYLYNEVHGRMDLSKYTKSARSVWRIWLERSCGPISDRNWRKLLRSDKKGRWWHEAM
ncbi:hypothetical protein [Paenibacillus assamensis]|uniref:hypothetical protein n=1 Tax=Paenibacillus assamensis TaxID=311244 RepID=UPI0003F7BA75|nr:hypothetical protein [Paenibacillus assamensis]